MMADAVLLAQGEREHRLHLALANRHGLITGATGTGKTVTLKVLAEAFSAAGVPVFVADVKGDLAGLSRPGEPKAVIVERAQSMGLGALPFAGMPAIFWDLLGRSGHPVRTTIAEMGPLLLARLLDLNPTQEGVLSVAFRVADDEGLLLLDLKDLRAMLAYLAENARTYRARYGNISPASVGAIQRAILALEDQGGDAFFGEPALEIADLMRIAPDGRGVVSILAADTLIQRPRLYATFLLWLLAELFETLPEIGDPEKPRLVFFFDEAHLLFDDAPAALREKVEQVVRLIRSKGVGVYFVTQNPVDIPDSVLGQLGNRVQHALRAFTARDQKALRQAAETFRNDGGLDIARVVQELAVGEALVSLLEPGGVPGVVERARIRPPISRLGPVSEAERTETIAASGLAAKYANPVDRHSAHEMLAARVEAREAEAERTASGSSPAARRGRRDGMGERVFKSVVRSAGSSIGTRVGGEVARSVGVGRSFGGTIGRAIMRGILGSLLGR